MDDNATCHRTLAVQDCLDSESIQPLVWPARSPDLNPIENVLDALGRQVAGRNYPPTNNNTSSVHSQRNGINCLKSCWIMLCKLEGDGRPLAKKDTYIPERSSEDLPLHSAKLEINRIYTNALVVQQLELRKISIGRCYLNLTVSEYLRVTGVAECRL
ncbi:hypothetical protein TNCV_2060031 [Trichonephila clavipes]|nr:hypothetical protein TNCV_2060031 [Trichonephila clavipes]